VNFLTLIEVKREGKILAPEQIQEFIREFTAGKIPDYQMAAREMKINAIAATTPASRRRSLRGEIFTVSHCRCRA
jgi:thymidine phosphorylase